MTPLELKALQHIKTLLGKVDPPYPTTGFSLTGESLESWRKSAEAQWSEASKGLSEAQRWLETLLEEAKK